MSQPKWTEEREAKLRNLVGDESPVSQETVHEAAEVLETSTRSISSKLRKMEYEVEKVSAKPSAFTDTQEAELRLFLEKNSGEFTYAEIAKVVCDGEYSPKQIQGKVLSMQLTEHVAPAPKQEAVKTYSPEEEAQFIELVEAGSFIEDIAEAMGRKIQSVRGKALSLLKAGVIDAIPKQRETSAASRVDPLAELGDLSGLTVTEISEKIGKTPRGVKTMLTRRRLTAKDYDGAGKAAKQAAG